MLEFQIKAQIYHQCKQKSTFDWISKFFIHIRALSEYKNLPHSNFIIYDEEFQFITYNFQRNMHMSLEELFVYANQAEFKKFANQIQGVLDDQDKIFQDEKIYNHLSVQNLDSSKIWFEMVNKKIFNVYILNFVPQSKEGKNISDLQNYVKYLLKIKPDVNSNQKNTKKNFVQKINQDIESVKLEGYSIQTLVTKKLNMAINAFYKGISDQYNKSEFLENFESILVQSKKSFTKVVEGLKSIANQPQLQNLHDKLSSFIKNEDSSQAKLELIIIKVIQKYNLFDKIFSKVFNDKNQINKFIKQYLREQIYTCLQQENLQIIPYRKIIIYLTILNFKKSTADLERQIQDIFQYTHERLAIFKYEWTGKIISDYEMLEFFLVEQTKVLKNQKFKIINKNLLYQTITQTQTYKERVSDLLKGLDVLKLHFNMELSTLAKNYFGCYQIHLMKVQNKKVSIDEIMSALFLDLVNFQLKSITIE
ncbi:unnamed protein product [Paramecium octaurelia]|uniref:Uncharacterized protein n=1 Tax=Paramecium octaurelia TaxID=43137 RepID=A0A8S1UPA3_PAROT|nr:unnamed protein product [Paramecium octaurelia]